MADERRDRGKGTMGGKGKKKKASKGGKKRVHKMTIRHAKSGGYIVEHHAKPENGQTPEPPEEHAVPDMEGLQQHVADNMGQEPEPQQAPPPVPAAGGAGAAGGGAMPPPGA